MKPKVAIVGANGFVGSRLVEALHLRQQAEVRPIVRRHSALAGLARFDLDWRVADAADPAVLGKAFRGCDCVVHSVVGESSVIAATARALYPAAAEAGVRRIVFLSSASVHGQAPPPGTTEESSLNDRQEVEYNNAKVRAERTLFEARKHGNTELVVLRPAIVFGPRDRWVSGLAAELQARLAWLIEGGAGICNTIYVDNLVHAIWLALVEPRADGNAFLVGDRERVTWADFYRAVSHGIGIDFESVHHVDRLPLKRGLRERLQAVRTSQVAQAILPWVPNAVKSATKEFVAALNSQRAEAQWVTSQPTKPAPGEEMTRLQSCRVQLPWAKAERMLGYAPPVSFEEGLRRTLGWLAFANGKQSLTETPSTYSLP